MPPPDRPSSASPCTYSMLADCIRSGQVPEAAVPGILAADPDFAAWYREKFGV